MPLENYHELVDQVSLTLSRGNLTAQIPTWIAMVEKFLVREIELEDAETFIDVEFVQGFEQSLPTGYLDMKHITINTEPPRNLKRIEWNLLTKLQGGTGPDLPMHYAIYAGKLWLDATGEELTGVYYYRGRIVPLSEDNPTNLLLAEAPDVMLYGTLLHSAAFIGDDERIATWTNYYTPALASFRNIQWNKKAGGGELAIYNDVDKNDRHKDITRLGGYFQ